MVTCGICLEQTREIGELNCCDHRCGQWRVQVLLLAKALMEHQHCFTSSPGNSRIMKLWTCCRFAGSVGHASHNGQTEKPGAPSASSGSKPSSARPYTLGTPMQSAGSSTPVQQQKEAQQRLLTAASRHQQQQQQRQSGLMGLNHLAVQVTAAAALKAPRGDWRVLCWRPNACSNATR